MTPTVQLDSLWPALAPPLSDADTVSYQMQYTPEQSAVIAAALRLVESFGITYRELGGKDVPTRSKTQELTPEQRAVVARVRKLVDFYGITESELRDPRLVRRQVAPSDPADVGPKYVHPVSGQTWDGSGSQPEWLKVALTREGYTVEELRLPLSSSSVSDPA